MFFFFLFFIISIYFLDVDECLSNPCDLNAACTDNEGFFVCNCNIGYSGNGLICSGEYVLLFNDLTYLDIDLH